jgi:hypothetical protein
MAATCICVPESPEKESRIGQKANADATPQEDEAFIIRRVLNNESLCGRFPSWSNQGSATTTEQKRGAQPIGCLLWAFDQLAPVDPLVAITRYRNTLSLNKRQRLSCIDDQLN